LRVFAANVQPAIADTVRDQRTQMANQEYLHSKPQ
jgi:hypothetical protein